MWKNPIIIRLSSYIITLSLSMLAFPISEAFAQTRVEGTAVVHLENGKHTVPIECDHATLPEQGFSTEPNRITRERTGRSSTINIRLRPSGEEQEIIISLDRYVGWYPQPASESGMLMMTLDLSPITIMKDGQPVLLTRDMWMNGDQPDGVKGVKLEAQCGFRDPDAPAYEKISDQP